MSNSASDFQKNMRRFLTRQQLAERWHVGPRTIDRYVRDPESGLKPIRLTDRRVLFPVELVERLEAQRSS